MPRRGRPFPAGQSGNPSGWPKGAKDRFPRPGSAASTLLRHALAPAFAAHPSELGRAIRAGLRNTRLALGYLELGAKLNGEIGRKAGYRVDDCAVIPVGSGAEAIAAYRAAAAQSVAKRLASSNSVMDPGPGRGYFLAVLASSPPAVRGTEP